MPGEFNFPLTNIKINTFNAFSYKISNKLKRHSQESDSELESVELHEEDVEELLQPD